MSTVYKIIECSHHDSLEREVNEHLRDGWQLQGGVSSVAFMMNLTEFRRYAQALVKVVA